MITKTKTKILWLGFSPIASFDCKAQQWRLYDLILHDALKWAYLFITLLANIVARYLVAAITLVAATVNS